MQSNTWTAYMQNQASLRWKLPNLFFAVRHYFASPTMDLEKDKQSTKQLQGSKKSTKQSKRMVQDPNNSTKKTSNSDITDTDSAYSTESESNYTLQPEDTYLQPVQDHAKYITRPSTCSQSTTILEHEITSTPPRTHPVAPPRPSKATNVKQTSANQWKQPTQAHPDPAPVRKSPLLPTLPTQHRQTIIPGPSTFNNSRNPTFTRPSPFYNRFHQQPFITRPSLIYNKAHQQPYTPRPFNHQQIPLLPLPSHQIPAFPGPYPQIPGHLTQQVYYIPVLLPYPPQYYTTWSKKIEDTCYI